MATYSFETDPDIVELCGLLQTVDPDGEDPAEVALKAYLGPVIEAAMKDPGFLALIETRLTPDQSSKFYELVRRVQK